MSRHAHTEHRGRNAEQPSEIPPCGWWDILWRIVKRVGNDNVSLIAVQGRPFNDKQPRSLAPREMQRM